MMDIELEKSRHEEWYKEKFPFLYKLYSNRMCRDEHEIAFANSETTWLAAKAQAVPEGFVLVPVIDIELALLEQFGPVHPAVLESQEQSHDGK
ncbi:MAG: hypothetical protein WB445_03290 [Acinetobacter sp.]